MQPAAATNVTNVSMWEQDTGTAATGLTTLVNSFNATHPNYHVTANYIATVGTSETAFTSKLAESLKANVGPALVVSDSEADYIPELLSTGDVVNLGPFMNAKSGGLPASSFYPGMLKAGIINGSVYSLPWDGGDYAVVYNKKLFAQAGISSTPSTWSQLTADAQKLTKGGVYGFYVPIGSTEWTVWTWEAMLWSEGGQLLNSNNTKVEFNSPQGVAALDVWLNLLQKHLAYPSDLANSTESQGYPGFQDGKVAMYLDGSYDLPTDDQALGAQNVGVFAFPATQTHAMNTGTNMDFILKGSTAQEEGAWAFIQYCMQPKNQAAYDITTGYLPTIKATGSTPAYQALLKKDPRFGVFLDELSYSHTRPSIPAYEAVSTALGNELYSAFLGKVSAAQALKTAAAQATAALASS